MDPDFSFSANALAVALSASVAVMVLPSAVIFMVIDCMFSC